MKIVVIDGQGGRIGKTIIEQIRKKLPNVEIIGVGANSIASSSMLKAGATACATGENAVVYNCGDADVICGVLGIAFANSMYGEISPEMARAVSQSKAEKYLIPIRVKGLHVLGIPERPVLQYVLEMVEEIEKIDHGAPRP
ncbi:DUF3842 family protein [Christensenellaceae bacterium OttesenSCG-928-K19]|nr:DUF3842 family protein [Christensenellaceae bacterium OttesenSCG-928-K19]